MVGHAIDSPDKLAKTVLTFMVKPLMGGKAFVFRFIPVFKLNAPFLYKNLLQALEIVNAAGGHCIAIISDNHAANRTVHDDLRKNFPLHQPTLTISAENVEWTKQTFKIAHPCRRGRTLHLLFDSVHLFKSIRNNWLTEKMQKLNFKPPSSDSAPVTADWKDLVNLNHKEIENHIKRTPLSHRALFPSSFDKQKVNLVNAIFHEKTVAALAEDGKSDTACFVYHVLRLWKILNNHNPKAHIFLNDPDRAPLTSSEDSSLHFLLEMANSLGRCSYIGQQRVQCLTKETSASVVQTLHGLSDLAKDLLNDGAIKYVLLGQFQSDCLEGEFGALRQLFGGMYFICLEQVLAGGHLRRLKLYRTLDIFDQARTNPKHKLDCCSASLSDDELNQLDVALTKVDEISTSERSTIFYICGYISKKEGFSSNDMGTNLGGDLDDSEFTRLVPWYAVISQQAAFSLL